MSYKPVIAISIGDLNGVGIDIALRSHKTISLTCKPLYCIDKTMLEQACMRLHVKIPDDFETLSVGDDFEIQAGLISEKSGRYSYDSFMKAIELCETSEADAVVTLPIHKEAWAKAGLNYVGHTDLLRQHFNQEAIMMLGCESMYVALFTEHIPLKEVPLHVRVPQLTTFLLDFFKTTQADKVAVLGLNPHAGDNGVLGDEEKYISEAIAYVNTKIGLKIFDGPIVPDVAFTPHFRAQYRYFIAMYHDQGLAPLKALYFDESVNISLNLPIIRTSVDHGTAFDIAYQKNANTLSYHNAIKAALSLI
ncbi:MAG: 4-hydroxythreonine-4-phosphate dehydrogenase [Campylobacterota bacterium]|nr:4-hydroxythreonine-4-phosphate dehydrogenase [Campylobacterota bacterium]